MDTTWRQAFSFYDFVSEGTQQIFNENEIFFLNAFVVFISGLPQEQEVLSTTEPSLSFFRRLFKTRNSMLIVT